MRPARDTRPGSEEPRAEALRVCELGALSIQSAASFSGLARSRLYELIDRHEIASLKVGRRRLIPRAELIRYLADHVEQ